LDKELWYSCFLKEQRAEWEMMMMKGNDDRRQEKEKEKEKKNEQAETCL
jgi:hypothetical protein